MKMSEKKIIQICNHNRVCRISSPPEAEKDIEAKLRWLDDRFGASLSRELIFEALNSIIKAFDAGLADHTAFEFDLIVRAEVPVENA